MAAITIGVPVAVPVAAAAAAAAAAYLEDPVPHVTVSPWTKYIQSMLVPADTLTITVNSGTDSTTEEYVVDRSIFLGAKDHWKIQTVYDIATIRKPCDTVVLMKDGKSLGMKRTGDALYISVDSPALNFLRIPYTCALACERIERWISAVIADYVPDVLDGMLTLVNVWSPMPTIRWSAAMRARMEELHGMSLDDIRTSGVPTISDGVLERVVRELGVRACFDDATDVTFIRLPRRVAPFLTFATRRINGKFVERYDIDVCKLLASLEPRIPLAHSVADSAYMRAAYYTGVECMLFTETLRHRA